MVMLGNGSGTHFGESQCISMDLATATATAADADAAAWCGYSLSLGLGKEWVRSSFLKYIVNFLLHIEARMVYRKG